MWYYGAGSECMTEIRIIGEENKDDNNLSACLFYIKTGFKIGGLDTNVYKGTKQEGKADIFFTGIAECKFRS